ncbi:putative kinesin [Trypanosoma conorhini]|uniref:MORN repeat-containing protein 3 n=1 Tax=Trypanosoma conorhini TaxID=83891 RepID=A0A422PNP8_9TRYP|nr:putative kinesin [Trypanosoma conorhini]RNF19365.1 putative kinesin [Trypanosoma conorhini]
MEDISSFGRLRVAVRERPVMESDFANVQLHLRMDEGNLIAYAPGRTEGLMYNCDYYFSGAATEEDIHCTIGSQMVDLAMRGVSCNAVFFGFTDTGKTHTLYGGGEDEGFLFSTVKDLYSRLEAHSDECEASIMLRYWEMNRDSVEDNLRAEDEGKEGIQYAVSRDHLDRLNIPNLTTVQVPTVEEFLMQLNRGNQIRMGRLAQRTFRWHGFVQLIIVTTDKAEGAKNIIRTMTFVHMKGTDRVGEKGMRGEPLREGSCINVGVTLLCAAVIHSLEYRRKRRSLSTTPERHRELIRHSQSFFMECKLSRVMSQFICGFEASFVIGCTSLLQYNESIETLENLQLFRQLQCVLRPIVVISERGSLLRKLLRQEALLGEEVVSEIYNSDSAGRPLTEEEEKLLLLHQKLYGTSPRRRGDLTFELNHEAKLIERCKSRAQRVPGKVETHGLCSRIFLNPSKTASYEGQWEDGKFGGFGELLQKRSKYRGEFRNGLREGEGTLWIRADAKSPWIRVYKGEWLAGKRDGLGVSWEENGDIYEGEWSEDKRNGFGRLFLANGDLLKGEFRNGLCDGRALLLQTNGDWYDGYWALGLREGPGLWCYVQRQQCLSGDWSKGICRCGTMTDLPHKTTNEHSRFIPRLGLLRDDEVLELQRRKLYDNRVREFATLGRKWTEPVIAPPLGAAVSFDDDGEKCYVEATDVEAADMRWGLNVE